MKALLVFLLPALSAAEEVHWFRGAPANEKSGWPYRYELKMGGEKPELFLRYRAKEDLWMSYGEAKILASGPGFLEFEFFFGVGMGGTKARAKIEFPAAAAEGFKANFTMPEIANDPGHELKFTPWTKDDQEDEANEISFKTALFDERVRFLSKIIRGPGGNDPRSQTLALEIDAEGTLTSDNARIEIIDLEAKLAKLKANRKPVTVKIMAADDIPWAKVRPVLEACNGTRVRVEFAVPEAKSIDAFVMPFYREMYDYLNSKEFGERLAAKPAKRDETETRKAFYSAGYLRAWKECRDYETWRRGPGGGKIEILEGGALYSESEGWIDGCSDAREHGQSIMKELEEIYKKAVDEEDWESGEPAKEREPRIRERFHQEYEKQHPR